MSNKSIFLLQTFLSDQLHILHRTTGGDLDLSLGFARAASILLDRLHEPHALDNLT